MSSNQILPVILCGGSGTRLWPLSRSSYPKQFLSLNENNENTFIQETFERLNGINQLMNPLIICNEEHRFIVGEQMREKNIEPKSILLEPFGRNTAPAITLAALSTLKNKEDPNLLILSADHFIQNKDKFQELIKIGLKYSSKGKIMTFGVPPTRPETGYGYIETEEDFKMDSSSAIQIKRFIEKPFEGEAKKMILNGNYLWNSGIFLGKSSVLIEEIKKFCPDIYQTCLETLNSSRKDLNFIRLGKDPFLKCPNISFDIAVMEKTDLGFVIPMDVGWSDVGTWNSLWMESSKDDSGNVKSGNVILDKSKNNLFISNNRLIVGLGIKDLIVVETNDALLVANRRNDQDVKTIVSLLTDKNLSEANFHKKVFRPWGNYLPIENGINWQVKRIEVKPKCSLSLQMHKHRAEHWIVVSGEAFVEIDDKELILLENQSTFIPLGSKHRLSNKKHKPLIIIEVQSGEYLGEDDIVRFNDNYGRK
jgi:mannose-1-phosphate guanylyltransferase